VKTPPGNLGEFREIENGADLFGTAVEARAGGRPGSLYQNGIRKAADDCQIGLIEIKEGTADESSRAHPIGSTRCF
jgi:hypothetical protein